MTREEFDRRLAEGGLALTFVGMSGIGKTRRAKQLRDVGFKYVSCDDLIAERLKSPSKLETVTDVGRWMGQPYEEGYREREKAYLDLEEEITRELLEDLRQNTMVDSTGSIVYLSDSLCEDVKKKLLVVYLKAEPDIYERMLALYHADPKPVVWADAFKMEKGESTLSALARSFPKLLDYRARKYEEMADVTLPAKAVWDIADGQLLLQLTREALG
ncbi:hypothetical protein A3A39_00910 [Candidatus Kaiserbacteria bacterium RIFCSPLOWO2_01_FULL_54_13]|uniref:Uncharacterized protein n=1 Tax=Candidatus Kaiserbacteria bacterium RIFCSPLOWO2_01_FULL_54_13 TaxID=1798512 RepID=A0A1F6F1S0_9BACT|nr:MAG: hypothetical protein A3A39_00910 [Candidatus Kaiserbacteria bacterium RIFCSPLOWO2_01_FULL_54_13]